MWGIKIYIYIFLFFYVLDDDKPSGIPQPEAPIDLEECRMKLLDHIDNYYQQLDDRLMSLQTQIAGISIYLL